MRPNLCHKLLCGNMLCGLAGCADGPGVSDKDDQARKRLQTPLIELPRYCHFDNLRRSGGACSATFSAQTRRTSATSCPEFRIHGAFPPEWPAVRTANFADSWPRFTRFDGRTAAPTSQNWFRQFPNCSNRLEFAPSAAAARIATRCRRAHLFY